jgi:hypothetical protein
MGKLLRVTLAAAALLALGGCVYAPPPPAYSYGYGYSYAPPAYYYGPPVSVGVGFGCCWHHHWR